MEAQQQGGHAQPEREEHRHLRAAPREGRQAADADPRRPLRSGSGGGGGGGGGRHCQWLLLLLLLFLLLFWLLLLLLLIGGGRRRRRRRRVGKRLRRRGDEEDGRRALVEAVKEGCEPLRGREEEGQGQAADGERVQVVLDAQPCSMVACVS